MTIPRESTSPDMLLCRPSLRSDAPALGGSFGTAPVRRDVRPIADAEAIAATLSAPTLSLEALRRAVVRYGSAARDLALAPEEMLAGLMPFLRRRLESFAPARRAELEASVQWWAIHGYHRAD